MRPLRTVIRQSVERTGIQQPVVERDYAISYILAGIDSVPVLARSLVFKGGTALKKLYIPNYRFSEDLDFSAVDAPKGDALMSILEEATEETRRLLNERGPFTLDISRYTEREPHPGGQEAFNIRVGFPWQRETLCRIKLEISHDEPVLRKPENRALIHGYEERLSVTVRCYCLEEIVAEKLRALLQTHERLVTRGWARPRARDYYDLWRILNEFGDTLEIDGLLDLLEKKCVHRGVRFGSIEDFFTDELTSAASEQWERTIVQFTPNAPSCNEVLERLRILLPSFFPELP